MKFAKIADCIVNCPFAQTSFRHVAWPRHRNPVDARDSFNPQAALMKLIGPDPLKAE